MKINHYIMSFCILMFLCFTHCILLMKTAKGILEEYKYITDSIDEALLRTQKACFFETSLYDEQCDLADIYFHNLSRILDATNDPLSTDALKSMTIVFIHAGNDKIRFNCSGCGFDEGTPYLFEDINYQYYFSMNNTITVVDKNNRLKFLEGEDTLYFNFYSDYGQSLMRQITLEDSEFAVNTDNYEDLKENSIKEAFRKEWIISYGENFYREKEEILPKGIYTDETIAVIHYGSALKNKNIIDKNFYIYRDISRK